jgi:hypothetical protein
MAYGVGRPLAWALTPWWQRWLTVRMSGSGERCVVAGRDHYVRARIQIPVIDTAELFTWGVWVNPSRESYRELVRRWNDSDRATQAPFFAYLSTPLDVYSEPTLLLGTQVHVRPKPERPLAILEPSDHPLAVEQHNGITMDRVREFAEMIVHQKTQ